MISNMSNAVLMILLGLILVTSIECADQHIREEENRAHAYLNKLNGEMYELRNRAMVALWNFDSNITNENKEQRNKVFVESAAFVKEKAKEILAFNLTSYENEDLRRQLIKLSKLSSAALPPQKYSEMVDALTQMQENYAKVRICSFRDKNQCNLQLEPDLTKILAHSDDSEELKYYWQQWYDAAGTPVRQPFDTYLRLKRESAHLNNFTSGAEEWLFDYEDSTIERQFENIFKEIRPLYQQIHAYVRHALRQKYPTLIERDGLIPMHLLGNMWGQNWRKLLQFTAPYPKKQLTHVSEEMIKQNYTSQKIFKLAEQFYVSLGFSPLPQSFWEHSILEKPSDGRDLVCHASAWDFFNGTDVRIKQCSRINMEDLFTAFHEMGHVYYFLSYKDQPYTHRDGANPGFHEAIGDVFALSASTPKHLEKVGLLDNYEYDEESKINELYAKALEKVVALPFAYALDKYRLELFRGKVKPDEYNCRFWEMREQETGIKAPVQRYKEDFDPPAKYHISADVEYLRYVASIILQFQIYKGACEFAGKYNQTNPKSVLSDCNFYNSKKAGDALKEMMSLGSSEHWSNALSLITGQQKMNASALLEYFKPLQIWLEKKNAKNGAHIGWESEFECLSKSKSEPKRQIKQ